MIMLLIMIIYMCYNIIYLLMLAHSFCFEDHGGKHSFGCHVLQPSGKLTSPAVEQMAINNTSTSNHVHHQNYENTTSSCENTEKTGTLGNYINYNYYYIQRQMCCFIYFSRLGTKSGIATTGQILTQGRCCLKATALER